MKKIMLTQNRYALVDDQDYEWAMQWKWHVGRVQKNHWYAMRKGIGPRGNLTTIYLHIELMKRIQDVPDCGVWFVDHVDGDGLDNRRHNIRWATRSENAQNTAAKRRLALEGA
jgi:hypothetical protein